ncbi:MAG: hypothetical protein HC817_02615 [Saprospiraceae bacterium]|nr:hypothetical protein [Saprospiraceae bacterium]
MMKTSVFLSRCALVLLGALSFAACKRPLMAKKMTQSMAQYVYAYTTGTVSREQPVRVRFTAPVVNVEEVGKAVAPDVFKLTPSVSGAAIWEDAQTIRFTATENFASGQTYLGAVTLRKIFKSVPKDAETFEFDFRTREMYFEVVTDGIQPDGNNVNLQELSGELVASDRAETAAIEKCLTAQQNGKSLIINWLHAPDGLKHTFKIKGVTRTNNEGKVNLAWNATAIGSNFEGKTEVIIPALGQFTAMNARLVQDAEQYVKINFSDPLSINQDLRGLVRINDFATDSRLTIDGNSVLLYPTERVVGEKSVFVEASVKNAQGKGLNAPANFPLAFSDIKPQVRLVGRGVILPNSDGLNFPFEAINLNYVDVEIVKIYNNNILQFLQTNDLDGAQEMARVGNIVMQKGLV